MLFIKSNNRLGITAFFFLTFISSSFIHQTAGTYFEQGLKDLKSKDYVKAIGDFTNALSLKNNFAEAYLQRGIAKIRLGEQMGFVNSEACTDFIMATKLGNKEAYEYLEKNCVNECYDIKSAFVDPEMVYCADFSNKALTDLPADIQELSNLVKLNLTSNKLAKPVDKISKANSLIYLDMSNNSITEIDPAIKRLTILKELNLNKNKLKTLPEELGELENLKSLYLRSNGLTELPRSIARLKSLENLDLSLNKLTTVPIEIANLKNLKTLILVGNDIPSNKRDIIQKLLPNTKIDFE